jgi:twitching motility two-component system response regulator PilG
MGNGKIHYANSSIGLIERCRYLLKKNALAQTLKLPLSFTKEYDYFYQLWKGKTLTYEESRAILECFTREALVHILSLPASKCRLSSENDLPMPLLNLDIEQIAGDLRHKIRCWQSLKPQINSPFQRPLVHDWPTVESWLKEADEYGDYWFTQLYHALSNLSCLYDIAHQTQSSTLDLSILFARLLKSEKITMLPYQEITIEERAHIVYIDENSTGQHIVSYSLEKQNFRVTSIADPCQALMTLQNRKVDVIIINAEMKSINGFQLTKLCRQTPQLEGIPIILIIENNNLIHDIKTKLSGASGYLHKPFLPQELIASVEKHLPNVTLKSNPND